MCGKKVEYGMSSCEKICDCIGNQGFKSAVILLPAHPASFAHKFSFQQVRGCNSIADLVSLRLFLAVPRGCLQFVIVVFPDPTHLLFLSLKIVFWTHKFAVGTH